MKVELGPDADGLVTSNFSLKYYSDSDLNTNLASGVTFSESTDTPGLYYSSDITIATEGDYTFVVTNTVDGYGNVTMPIVVTKASMGQIYDAVDTVEATLATVAADVAGLDGDTLTDIQASVDNVKSVVDNVSDLINNKSAELTFTGADETANLVVGDTVTGQTSGALGYVTASTFGTDTVVTLSGVVGEFTVGEEIAGTGTTTTGLDTATYSNTTVDSVMEFVSQIDAALQDGGSALQILEEDLANIMAGSEFLSDGTTANPLYDATNPGVATSAELQIALGQLQADIGNIDLTEVTSLIGTAADTTSGTLFGDLYLAKQVIDANKALLDTNATEVGLIKGYVDNLETRLGESADGADVSVWGDVNAIQAEIANGTYGLAAIQGQLDTIETKVDTANTNIDKILGGGIGATVFA